MACLSDHHRNLTNGVGKCSVPMWSGGCPGGFCDAEAYGRQPSCEMVYHAGKGRNVRADGGYDGYVPALACIGHGGPSREKALNLCKHCFHDIPSCDGNPMFGTGKGADNVISCGGFTPKTD